MDRTTIIPIARYLRDLALWFLAVAAGPLAYWALPRDMGAHVGRGWGRFRWHWADAIWGNEMDGLSGDAGYIRDHVMADPLEYRAAPFWGWPVIAAINAVRRIRRRFPAFWWTCIRNPANNLARHIGPAGVITHIQRRGVLTLFETNSGHGLRRGFFLYTPRARIMLKLGYKLWPDAYEVGDVFDGALAFSIQRGRK